jgi:hypothetical protein
VRLLFNARPPWVLRLPFGQLRIEPTTISRAFERGRSVSCWPISEAEAAGRGVRLLGCCGRAGIIEPSGAKGFGCDWPRNPASPWWQHPRLVYQFGKDDLAPPSPWAILTLRFFDSTTLTSAACVSQPPDFAPDLRAKIPDSINGVKLVALRPRLPRSGRKENKGKEVKAF